MSLQLASASVVCALAALALSATPMLAQDVTCNPEGAQAEMNVCAYEDFEAADTALNVAYRKAMATARAGGFDDKLRAAQRLWLPFRDAACEAEAAPFEGSTLQPLIRYSCLATLTEERTKALVVFQDF